MFTKEIIIIPTNTTDWQLLSWNWFKFYYEG